MRSITIAAVLMVGIAVGALLRTGVSNAQAIPADEVEGFAVMPVKIDQGKNEPSASIPKTWRLISVSNGEKENSNNLWFQAQDGSIYVVCAYTNNDFTEFKEIIGKVEVK